MEIDINYGDGASSVLTADDHPDRNPSAPVALLKPAMGVRASFYEALREPLWDQGIRMVSADLRGHGRSSVRPGRGRDFGFREMLEYDWPEEVATVRRRWPDAPVVLLGHSLGGQLSLLHAATHPGSVDAVITCAACSVYWRTYPGGLAVLGFSQLAALIARVVGYYPGHRLGFAGLEARRFMADWAHQARTGNYRASGSDLDLEAALASMTTPALIITIDGDRFAPGAAADHLASKLPASQVSRKHITLEDVPSVHFRWVSHAQPVCAEMGEWLTASNLLPPHS